MPCELRSPKVTAAAVLARLALWLGLLRCRCTQSLRRNKSRRTADRVEGKRRGVAEWLVEQLGKDIPTMVGIDHGFSFPLRYFEVHGIKPDWPTFLDDFQRHWPTDENSRFRS